MEVAIGRPAREILGRTNTDVFPPGTAERFEVMDQEVLRSRQDLQSEEQISDARGVPHHFIANLFPLVDTTGQCWGLGYIATDITERLLADQALLQTQKLESLGVLAGGIAHDFNNLLAAMRGNVELALMEDAPGAIRPHLETVMGLMSKASDLLQQMLAYAGRGKATVTVLDLNQLVGDMAQLLATSISKKALLRRDLHPEPLLVEADPSQLQQVLMNLVINASEAVGEQSGTITLRTRREDLGADLRDFALAGRCLAPGRYVSLEVADDGAGMPPEVLRKIFDPFFTTKFAGRGLGLAAIHGIVRGHHGGIRVQSEPGRGSAFKLVFPEAAGPLKPSSPEPRAPEPAPVGVPSGTVLVVDDEAAIRGMTVKALAKRSIPTLQARDGREALRVFEQNRDRVRLILMDLTMPNLDGEETLRELRRRGATVPVILSSGFNQADILGRFEGLELAGFIKKPFALAELVSLVAKVLSG
jgi:signal transduction histidine kinase/CheY-like chemotaxis protein